MNENLQLKEEVINKGLLRTKTISSSTGKVTRSKKRIRHLINEHVFDVHDSVADTVKIAFLILSCISRLYNASFSKTKLKKEDKELIEATLATYTSATTNLDVQFSTEGGVETLQKLLKRQAIIGEIMKAIQADEDISDEDIITLIKEVETKLNLPQGE